MVTHSSALAWRIPWTEEPGGLQSTGAQSVAHDRSDLARVVVTLFSVSGTLGEMWREGCFSSHDVQSE